MPKAKSSITLYSNNTAVVLKKEEEVAKDDDAACEEVLRELEEADEDIVYFVDNDGNLYPNSPPPNEELNKTKRITRSRAVKESADANNSKNETFEVFEFSETQGDKTGDDPSATITKAKKTPAIAVLRCSECDYTTSKKFLLLRHLKTHTDDRPFKCSVCERGFKTNNSLSNHLNIHMGKKPYICEYCNAAFTTAGEVQRHTRYRHTLEKPHKCPECDYCSVELSKLRRHIRCHTGERPYQCPHCTYASQDTFKLKRHLRTHTGEKPYVCDICSARFTQSNSLKAHRLIHSVGDKPVFQCDLCPTTCGRKTDLRAHKEKLHNENNPVTCKRCGQTLRDRYTYKVHVRTHEMERCFRCTICPYASVSQRQLDNHKLVHTDAKPYRCEKCSMGFRQRQLLKRHINLYHDENYVRPQPREKAHCCPHCDRSFTHKGNLIRHMEIHDPDSNVEEQKLQLKLGRLRRLDESTLVEESNEEFEVCDLVDNAVSEEVLDYEIIDEVEDEKPNMQTLYAEDLGVSTIETKEDKEFIENDDENYMVVEVIDYSAEEGEDDDDAPSTSKDFKKELEMLIISEDDEEETFKIEELKN